MGEKSAHLLIVDDEESIRSALRRVLRRDYTLSFAASGPEGLKLLKTERPDVIISDHLMPEMTGLELLKRCRLLYPNMGRVVLTGQAEMTMVIKAPHITVLTLTAVSSRRISRRRTALRSVAP